MVKLTKPKILTSSAFQTKAGKVKFTEKRYNLSNKVQGKEIRNTDELTNSVKKKISGMVKEKGAIIVSVAYWMDKIYSTNTIVLEKEDDIVKLKFDEFMEDYDGEGVPDGRVKQVSIIFSKIPIRKKKAGDDNKQNDCLFNALRTAYNKTTMPSLLNDPAQFKTWCGVGRDDKIDLVEMIPKLEKKLKLNLTCHGNYEYESKRKYAGGLTLKTSEGHVEHAYYIKHWKDLTHGYKVNDVRKYPIVYKKNIEDNTVKLCKYYKAGKGSRKIWTEDMTFLDTFYKENPMRKMFFLKSVESNEEPEDVIDKYIKQMIDFRQCAYDVLSPLGLYVNGTMNPFNSQSKFGPIGLNYWYNTCPRSISDCDDIDCIEQNWIANAMTGAIVYKQDGTYRGVYEYDINSMYPHLLTVIDFITRRGKYKTVSKIKLKNDYQIFRCVINGIDKRIMRHNPKNYYTTLDIKTALENGYSVELIQDGEPNCLKYGKRTRLSGHEVFNTFVSALYKMKSQGCRDAKLPLNYLWGYLASRALNEVNTYQKDLAIDDITDIKKIFHRSVDKDNNQHYTFRINDKTKEGNLKRFKFAYARFAPFLLARGRRTIHEATKDHLDSIVRIHTDGWITTKEIDNIDVGDGLGQFKVKHGDVIVGKSITWL